MADACLLVVFVGVCLVPSQSSAQQRRIAVLPIGGPGLTAEIAQRHLDAIVVALESRGGLTVQQVTDPRRVGPFVACERDACREAWVDQHTPAAQGVVVARIERPAPGVAARLDSSALDGDEGSDVHAAPQEATPAVDRPVRVQLESYDASGVPLPPPASAWIPAAQLDDPRGLIRAAVDTLTLPAAPPRARVLLAANTPGASVLVDGHGVGEIPLRPLLLPPGQHRVRVTASGFSTFDARIEVSEGERLRLDVDLEPLAPGPSSYGEVPGGRRIHWGVWVGAGAAALLLGTVLAITLSGRDGGGFPVPPIQP